MATYYLGGKRTHCLLPNRMHFDPQSDILRDRGLLQRRYKHIKQILGQVIKTVWPFSLFHYVSHHHENNTTPKPITVYRIIPRIFFYGLMAPLVIRILFSVLAQQIGNVHYFITSSSNYPSSVFFKPFLSMPKGKGIPSYCSFFSSLSSFYYSRYFWTFLIQRSQSIHNILKLNN